MKKHSCMSLDHRQFHKSHRLFAHQSFNSDSNWPRFALKLSGKQGLLLWGSEGWHSPPLSIEYCTRTYTKTSLKKNTHFRFIFIRISISFHQSDHSYYSAMYKRNPAWNSHLHKPTFPHTPHYFQRAISLSNYRKIHCPLMSTACRVLHAPADWKGGKSSFWERVWTTESLPRDVNHCLSRDHLH